MDDMDKLYYDIVTGVTRTKRRWIDLYSTGEMDSRGIAPIDAFSRDTESRLFDADF